jgi:hypothetical protein
MFADQARDPVKAFKSAVDRMPAARALVGWGSIWLALISVVFSNLLIQLANHKLQKSRGLPR